MACNRYRLESDLLPLLGKDCSPRWIVLLDVGGVLRFDADGLVVDKAITHYPS